MSIKKLFKEVFFPILALPLIVAPHKCPDFFSTKKKGKLSFFQSFKLKGDNAMPYGVDESRKPPFYLHPGPTKTSYNHGPNICTNTQATLAISFTQSS